MRRASVALSGLRAFDGAGVDSEVCWFETYNQGFALHRTPLDVAPLFRGFLERWQAPWVFTSATLTVGGSFAHFRSRLGLDEARELLLGSPFDYQANALLYLPPELPDPGPASYIDAVREAVRPVIMAAQGRTFVLVTSHAALRHLSETFTDLPFPILVQGTAPKRELLQRFRELGNAVLFGTASFWEGVDVRGSSLSCVIIDKLPFASPGEPVLQARLEALRERGGEPFRDYQLPQAVIALKQGAGRLIRDVTDRGVLVLCDPRLRRRHYGKLFLESLPPLPVTDELADVEAFFAAESAGEQPADAHG